MSGRRKAAPIKVLELREDGVCESGLELSPCTSSDLFKEQQDGVESASFLRTGMIDKLNDDNSKDRDASPSTTEEVRKFFFFYLFLLFAACLSVSRSCMFSGHLNQLKILNVKLTNQILRSSVGIFSLVLHGGHTGVVN